MGVIVRKKKLGEVQQLIEECSGLYVEATTTQENTVQGEAFSVSFLFDKRKNVNAGMSHIHLENFDSSFSANLPTNQNVTFNKVIAVAADKKISQPYWLEYPQLDGSFDVRDQLFIGKAENDPSYDAVFTMNIEGADITVKRPVQYKVIDPVKGEVFQPLSVLPRLELSYTKENYVSLNGKPVTAQVHFKSNTKDSTQYTIRQQYPSAWENSMSSFNYFDTRSNKENSPSGIFSSKSNEINTREEIKLSSSDGKYDHYTKIIAYDHIPTITYFPKAKANLVKVDIKIVGKKIGYIIGAGDKVPDALEQMGYEITFLNEADITDAGLKKYDAILVGIRAYNIYEYLTTKNDVMNRYVENGGNLIVQYMKSNQVGLKRIKVGPYPFQVNPGTRVTEEDAKVHFLLPEHPLLNYPNKITDKDFENWVQERSTYQAEQFDAKLYEAPLGMNDTGEKESNGSLITAKYGKGNFIYVGLVLFRQLPAGLPGAYRLMANLIALPKNK